MKEEAFKTLSIDVTPQQMVTLKAASAVCGQPIETFVLKAAQAAAEKP